MDDVGKRTVASSYSVITYHDTISYINGQARESIAAYFAIDFSNHIISKIIQKI